MIACGRAAPSERPGPDGLAAMITTIDRAHARDVVASWKMSEELWDAQVMDAYRAHWRDYAAAFDAAAPALADRLASLRGDVRAQTQYADDPSLTDAQIRVRWIFPVGRPGAVAWIGGERLDVVFVHDGDRWRALLGADAMIRDAVRALEPGCVPAYLAAGPPGRCSSFGAVIAEAAMRGQRDRLHRACEIAAANGCAPSHP
ncbi:MAG TPA: hypothetical protein VL463_15945 [Kofleriaceae bacterium]|nr:hypothetical protein [Kofleriaceae bacterium]